MRLLVTEAFLSGQIDCHTEQHIEWKQVNGISIKYA